MIQNKSIIQKENQFYLLLLLVLTTLFLSACKETESDTGDAPNSTNYAGFQVSSISGDTSESGGTASFTAKLYTKPSSDVTITVTSDDITEGTVSPSSLTFTTENYSTAQTVTVTGVNDFIIDGNVSHSISMSGSSSDADYNESTISSVSLTNTDDDTLGVTVISSDTTTTEGGTTGTFTVALATEPSSDVTITVTSDDTTEGTVSPSTLTFTNGDFSTAQTVTVTGIDDNSADGDTSYSISMEASSDSGGYNGFTISSVSMSNTDDDTLGVTVTSLDNTTTEGAGTGSFTVTLGSDPSSDVTITITSDDTTEGTVSPSTLTFTHGNFSDAQTVTVTGVDDNSADGDTTYSISMEASSDSGGYNGITISSVSLINSESTTWVQEAYIKANNAEAFDHFGYAVSLSNNTLAVGAHSEDNSATTITNGSGIITDSGTESSSGAVYVYKRNSSDEWAQEAYIKANNTGENDEFGRSIFLSDDTLAVGAYREDNATTTITNGIGNVLDFGSTNDSGAVYVYKRNSSDEWAQEAYIKASNAGANDGFGAAISLSNDTLVVGVNGEDNSADIITNGNGAITDSGHTSNSGAVYVYKRGSNDEWAQEAYIKANNAESNDTFGYSVSLSTDTLAVGASGEDNSATTITNGSGTIADSGTASDSGAVYIYKRGSNDEWVQEAYIKANNAGESDNFGYSVFLSTNTLTVGATGEDNSATTITNGSGTITDSGTANDSGAVYIYKRDASNDWAQEAYIKANNAEADDNFGHSISLFSDTLAVGAWEEDNAATIITNESGTITDSGTANNSGAVYVYKRVSNTWDQEAYIKANNADAGDAFGKSVSLSTDTLAVGAWIESNAATTITNGNGPITNSRTVSASGAVYVYKRTTEL